MNNPYQPIEHDNEETQSSASEESVQWVELETKAPCPIDVAIKLCKEHFCRKAWKHNWDTVTSLLHPTFMTMKAGTKNWTQTPKPDPIPQCSCLPNQLKKRMVDLVNIFGMSAY
jgi:hypothetical protein